MTHTSDNTPAARKNPATKYQIEVLGEIPAAWKHRFADMDITTLQRDHNGVTTRLVGGVKDQSELSGLLNSLLNLHLSISLVHRIEPDHKADN